MLKEFITFLIMELVEDRDAVDITQQHEEKKIIITVHVSEKDFGRVIGKGGQTIRSIRSLVSTVNKEKDNQVVVAVTK